MKQLEIEKGFNTDYPTRIDLCEGKYSVIYDFETGQSECLRYGEREMARLARRQNGAGDV